MMKIAIAGTNGLAQFIAYYLSELTSHNFVLLSRTVCPPEPLAILLMRTGEPGPQGERMAGSSHFLRRTIRSCLHLEGN